ncbi:GntR family transcriptional regulator [Mesorhizobium sp. RP14(2022)]|uniref:GntR family transcriptional regulator n=1 Tax=Mesorhizobium liriopis TaxID=2953882 RepID=A0ABT1C319_9HYPH|nr:GntR family transcriptional regulator [Mesorhizobium liriopis]MCO6049232.1 GntR family transcriptional regulator [Mesorhizobium liriopis]
MAVTAETAPNKRSTHIRVERPQRTLRELALEKMRESILERYFKPGERLVERDLCEQLGVSRTIVREVLRHLESEGLVSSTGLRGPAVAETSLEEARQIYEIRGALEGMAAGICAERKGAAAADELDAVLARIREAYAVSDMRQVLAETIEFYRTMFAAAECDVAWNIVSSLTARINHLRSMTINTKRRDIEGPTQMGRIVEAIRLGNRAEAAQAAAIHVANASQIAQALLQKSDDRA